MYLKYVGKEICRLLSKREQVPGRIDNLNIKNYWGIPLPARAYDTVVYLTNFDCWPPIPPNRLSVDKGV